jgi:hypothetical protein
MKCFHCGRVVEFAERVGFRERCPACDRPAHACLNCTFYDPAYHNQCREIQADRVVDKDRANFCEFFQPRAASEKAESGTVARAKLEALFKKS